MMRLLIWLLHAKLVTSGSIPTAHSIRKQHSHAVS
jgi:hypothetical protein